MDRYSKINAEKWYETVKSEMDKDQNKLLHRDVFGYMVQNAVGKRNSITIFEIALNVIGYSNASSDRRVRRCLEILRKGYKIPVMSSPGCSGRWLAESAEEIKKAANEMDEYAETIKSTARSLKIISFSFGEL